MQLTNNFHKTTADVRLFGRDGYINPSELARIRKILCGRQGCICAPGGLAGTRGPQYRDGERIELLLILGDEGDKAGGAALIRTVPENKI